MSRFKQWHEAHSFIEFSVGALLVASVTGITLIFTARPLMPDVLAAVLGVVLSVGTFIMLFKTFEESREKKEE